MKILIILFFSLNLFAGNIISTKKEIKKTQYYISKMNQKLDALANKIEKKQQLLNNLNNQIQKLNKEIKNLQIELVNSNKQLSELNSLKKAYEEKSQNIQAQIINFISENYFINSIKTENLNDLINKEISQAILKKYSNKINSLINQNTQIITKINLINNKIDLILKKKKKLKEKKQKLSKLLQQQKKELMALNHQKAKYKAKLQNLINKQKALQNQLVNLKIIKKRQKTTASIHVKEIGNVYFKPKIAYYNGPKTIAPIQGKIIKKFGSYIDPIYKIKIYNDSITIKPYTPESVVRSILNGKVVYIGENNDKKIIVIKHKNNLFSIYANLDKISPLLKKGSYVKRGQIIARVKNSLEFEVTYKEKPINPIKIISIK